MAQIATVALTDTFDSWRIRTNSTTTRMNQFAINESAFYANTITANVAFVAAGTTLLSNTITFAGSATAQKNLTVSGNTTLGAAGKQIGTTGLLAHTGRATISTNLAITGNTAMVTDSKFFTIGAGGDLSLSHNGSLSTIDQTNDATPLHVLANTFALKSSSNSKRYMTANTNVVVLYHNDGAKLTTKSDGVDITGELQTDTLDVDSTADFADNINMSGSSKLLTLNNNMLDEFTEFARALANSGTSVTLDTDDNVQQYTLTGNVTFTLPALSTYPDNSVKTITIIVKQDGTGSRTVGFSATDGVSFNNSSSAPQPTTAANKVSMYTCVGVKDLTEWFVSLSFIDD